MARVRCFEIVGGIILAGIPITPDGQIRVGCPGRGRVLTRVPLPPHAEVVDGDEGSRLMSCEVSDPDAVAVILIRDHSGYRGDWWLSTAATGRCPREGQERTWIGLCPDCGAEYWHRLVPAEQIEPTRLGRVIAEGYCAQGLAGRMGGGPEFLIAAHPGTWAIRRRGRTYGKPTVLNVTVTSGEIQVVDAAADIASKMAANAW